MRAFMLFVASRLELVVWWFEDEIDLVDKGERGRTMGYWDCLYRGSWI